MPKEEFSNSEVLYRFCVLSKINNVTFLFSFYFCKNPLCFKGGFLGSTTAVQEGFHPQKDKMTIL